MALFVKKPIPVEAVEAEKAGIAETKMGPVPYKAGDYLITQGDETYPCPRETFLATYEPYNPVKEV